MQGPLPPPDELLQRSDDEMKSLLASLDPPHIVYESSTHGVNNCLIDSIILSLISLGVAVPQALPQRAAICAGARLRLMEQQSVGALDYLSHEDHFDTICVHLRSLGTQFWQFGHDPKNLAMTVVVFDRMAKSWDHMRNMPFYVCILCHSMHARYAS